MGKKETANYKINVVLYNEALNLEPEKRKARAKVYKFMVLLKKSFKKVQVDMKLYEVFQNATNEFGKLGRLHY